MRFQPKYFMFICLCGMILSCGEHSEQVSSGPAENRLPEDFREFYVKFHRDTAFQMAHISWPLTGLRAAADAEGESTWTREEWLPHTQIPSSIEYNQKFNVLSEDMIIETIQDKTDQYAMQRRFARTSDGWSLIYYVEMQPARLR